MKSQHSVCGYFSPGSMRTRARQVEVPPQSLAPVAVAWWSLGSTRGTLTTSKRIPGASGTDGFCSSETTSCTLDWRDKAFLAMVQSFFKLGTRRVGMPAQRGRHCPKHSIGHIGE